MEQKYIDRFHTKYLIDPSTNCWNWTGSLINGYGRFSVGTKYYMAHRFSAMIHGLDMSGAVMRHMCNNPRCVNPNHLKTGSQQDNENDKVRAGRQARGETQHLSVVTEQQVLEIRSKYIPRKYTLLRLAKEFNISKATVCQIINGKTWKHI